MAASSSLTPVTAHRSIYLPSRRSGYFFPTLLPRIEITLNVSAASRNRCCWSLDEEPGRASSSELGPQEGIGAHAAVGGGGGWPGQEGATCRRGTGRGEGLTQAVTPEPRREGGVRNALRNRGKSSQRGRQRRPRLRGACRAVGGRGSGRGPCGRRPRRGGDRRPGRTLPRLTQAALRLGILFSQRRKLPKSFDQETDLT